MCTRLHTFLHTCMCTCVCMWAIYTCLELVYINMPPPGQYSCFLNHIPKVYVTASHPFMPTSSTGNRAISSTALANLTSSIILHNWYRRHNNSCNNSYVWWPSQISNRCNKRTPFPPYLFIVRTVFTLLFSIVPNLWSRGNADVGTDSVFVPTSSQR